MGIFENLFKSKNIKITDKDFGEIKSFNTNGDQLDGKFIVNF